MAVFTKCDRIAGNSKYAADAYWNTADGQHIYYGNSTTYNLTDRYFCNVFFSSKCCYFIVVIFNRLI